MSDRILMLLFSMAVPLITMMAGACMYFFMFNSRFFGYRTQMSAKNVMTRKFANRYAGRLMFFGSIAMLPVSILVMLLIPDRTEASPETVFTVLCMIQVTVLLAEAAATEIALHRYFDKNGNPRRKDGLL